MKHPRVRNFTANWIFDEETGTLHHPCGCLTSQFRWEAESEVWCVKEWACDMSPKLQKDLVTWINEHILEGN